MDENTANPVAVLESPAFTDRLEIVKEGVILEGKYRTKALVSSNTNEVVDAAVVLNQFNEVGLLSINNPFLVFNNLNSTQYLM